MTFTQRVIERPVTVVVLFALLIGLALFMVPKIALDLFPSVNPPIVIVRTAYDGAGAEEVEQNLTIVLEGQLANVSDLDELTSTSSEGLSMIIMEFDFSKDLNEALDDIRDQLDIVSTRLPQDADTPISFKIDPSQQAIMNLVVTGDKTPEELREIADNDIKSKIERINGVSTTSIRGGRESVVRVEVSQNRLEAYNLTLTSVSSALVGQNVQVGGGSIERGDIDYYIRTDGEFSSIDEIKDTVIALKSGRTADGRLNSRNVIRLGDIAEVSEGYEDSESIVKINSESGVYLEVQKESGSNSVNVAQGVIKSLSEINRSLPAGIKVEVLYDSTEMIGSVLNTVIMSAIQGMILAMLILLLFLRNVRSTFIVGMAIPISIFITVMCMYFFDLTLNMMTLAGLILGLGMIVDGAIVILENIYQYRERGTKLKTAASLGSHEMYMSIIASNLTTICVFLPIIIFKNDLGMMGEIFMDLVFTIVISLLVSLIVALSIVPVLCSHYIKIYTPEQRPIKNRFFAKLENTLAEKQNRLESVYKKILASVLENRGLAVFAAVLLLVVSVQQFSSLGIELTPHMDEDSVKIEVVLPPGTTVGRTDEVLEQLQTIAEKEINSYKDDIIITAGTSQRMGSVLSYKGNIEITLSDEKGADSDKEIKSKMREYFSSFPDAELSFATGRRRMGNSSPVDILVKSDDLERGVAVSDKVLELIKDNLPGITDAETDMDKGIPQYEIEIDRDRSYSLGVDISSIANEVKYSLAGKTATTYRAGGEEYDVLLVLQDSDRANVPDLDKISVLSSTGERVSLSNIASPVQNEGPLSINREDEIRTVHVTGDLAPGYPSNTALSDIKQLIADNIVLEPGTLIEYGGDFKDTEEYTNSFGIILIMAGLLVFGVMASQFESFKDPGIIFFSVPMMLIGVIWFYKLTGITFSLFSAVGLVVLVGLVVNNGIVLVDYTNRLRNRGFPVKQACLDAAGSRLRPILMTTFTTILGMLPLALSTSGDTAMVRPTAQTIIGGLSVSSLITLFVTPAVYSLLNREKSVVEKDGGNVTSETADGKEIEEKSREKDVIKNLYQFSAERKTRRL